MSKVKMIARDTLHVSSVKQDNLLAGETFETDEGTAAVLEKRGLADRASRTATKKAAPLKNKADAPPSNKAD